jgi:thiamine-phosphate pyrophosphorylase
MRAADISGYYFITDSKLSRFGNLYDVTQAVSAGVNIVQYRNKAGTTKELYAEAVKLCEICRKGKTLFIVNDRLDISMAVGAHGVHIGQDDMPLSEARRLLGAAKIIGVTAHSVKEALSAQRAGADYIGVSPIFATATKHDAGKPAGIELINKVKKAVKIPIVAIGGINLKNAVSVVTVGADCLCAVSAVVASNDPKAQIIKFQQLFKKTAGSRQ